MENKNQKSDDLAIVLVSGGMDSLAALAIAKEKHQNLAMLHINYGQLTEEKELDCFQKLAKIYGVKKDYQQIIDTSFFSQIGGSSLTDKNLEVHSFNKELLDAKKVPNTYVPFRNTVFLSLAVAWAEVIHAKKIYIGAVYEDSSGYPDCSPQYYEAMNELLKVATCEKNIEILTPLLYMKKADIVLKAKKLHAPLEHTWSCYKNLDKACGLCDSCYLRLKGFKEAGIEDPIAYQK